MASIKKFIPFVLRWEGGFADHPLDKGGPTNRGITIGTYRAVMGQNRTVEDLKNMTTDEWTYILRRFYWNPFKADRITHQSIAEICVDWAWASGTKTAIKQVQRILRVRADGIVGPQTLGAINGANALELFLQIRKARLRFVEKIVERDPAQKVFVKGWKNRINTIEYEDD